MHGIPFALKDLYDTAGITTTSGSHVENDCATDVDATIAARLKTAGGILIGKFTVHEFVRGGRNWITPS